MNDHIKNKTDLPLVNASNEIVENLSRYFLLTFPDTLEEGEIMNYLNSTAIEYFEPNFQVKIEQDKIPKEQYIFNQWYLWSINVFEAWKKATGKGIRVGIIDTGIDFLNPDLESQLWINSKEDINHTGRFEPWDSKIEINGISGDLDGVDDDGNGFADDVIGYDFVDQPFGNFGDFSEIDPIPSDENGHGTMVAGVIAAGMNQNGIVGVAPGAKIVTLRAFDLSGNSQISNIASAIVYAALNKIEVINFSFGSKSYSRILYDAIKFAKAQGCIMVASAGNDGLIEDHYPSNFSEVISVGASTQDGKIGSTSNYGPFVDIYAPGYQIFTTTLDGKYRYVSGTSFSAPIISATCAILLEINHSLSSEEIISSLKATGSPIVKKGYLASGYTVNVSEAVNFIATSLIDLKSLFFKEELSSSRKTISVLYSVVSPFLESYDLILLKENHVFKNIFTNATEQILYDTFNINISDLSEGKYYLKLLVRLRNGNIIERNVEFSLFDNDTVLYLNNLEFYNATYENKVHKIFVSKTNHPTYCNITAFKNGKLISQYSDNTYTTKHFVLIPSNSGFLDEEILFVVSHKTKWGKEVLDTISVYFPSCHLNLKELSKVFSSLPLSYVFSKVIDFGDAKYILLNPYDNLNWSKMFAFKFVGNLFNPVDSIGESWIPVDTGDIDKDGVLELLLTRFGKTMIVKLNHKLGNFFSTPIYTSKADETRWASQIVDIDFDGTGEIITYDDFRINFSRYINNSLQDVYYLTIPDTFGAIGTRPNILVSDFDKNGKLEVIFVTTRGYLLNYEFQSEINSFTPKWYYKLNGDQSSIFLAIHKNLLSNGSTILALEAINVDSDLEDTQAYWQLFEFTSLPNDRYKARILHRFYGVRIGAVPQGFFYRNGIQCNDLNGDAIDEILVCIFPNFYLLSYSQSMDSLDVITYLPYVYTNSAIVEDFDSDGNKEIGLSTWESFSFFEIQNDKKLSRPQFVDGWVDLNDSVYIVWQKVINATSYEIYILNPIDSTITLLVNTSLLNYSVDKNFFKDNDTLIFFVKAIDENGNYKSSDLSYPVWIFLNKRTKPIGLEVLNRSNLVIYFDGKLPLIPSFVDFISIINNNGLSPKVSSVQRASEKTIIVVFESDLEYGKYNLEIASFRDSFGNYSIPQTFDFEIMFENSLDTILLLKRAIFLEPKKIILEFTEHLDSNSASSIKNYWISPFGRLEKVEFLTDYGNQVFIEIAKEPNIFSLGLDFYLNFGKIFSFDSTKWISSPFNKLALTRAAQEINDAFAYPNPIKLNSYSVLTFANLPSKSRIEIYDAKFNKIAQIENASWKGGVSLDFEFSQTEKLDSGVYYFRVVKTFEDGIEIKSTLKKFSVVR
ncbi:MAG: S8 family serine peptidase [Candidatus Kapaibacteriales bacterium]